MAEGIMRSLSGDEQEVACRVSRGGSFVARAVALASGFLGGLALLTAMLSLAPTVFIATAILSLPAIAYLFGTRVRSARLVVQRGVLRLRHGEREELVAIGDVETCVIVARDAVTLGLGSGRTMQLDLGGASADEAMRTFGLDLDARALGAPLRATIGAFTLGFMTLSLVSIVVSSLLVPFLGIAAVPLGFALAVAATVLVVRRWGAPRVVVGADGIRVSGSGSPIFVSYADIAEVQATSQWSIEVRRRKGGPLGLPTVGQSEAQVKALVARIRAGMRRHARTTSEPIHVLERNGRALDRWRAELGRVFAAGSSFREQALSREALESVLGDAKAPAERRIGAALALRVANDESTVRIRVAADTCADEELKRAFDAICDDALDEATLARLEKRSR